jgi:hypothetical protein
MGVRGPEIVGVLDTEIDQISGLDADRDRRCGDDQA